MSDVARHALIVATDTYVNDGLDHLRSPGQDAVVLAGVLENPEIGGFVVDVVRNEPAHVILRRVEDFFADRSREHSLLLHFSCHGLKNASGELFFAATDTLPGRLSSTAVPADFVRRCMNEGRSRNTVLFLDCCYGGAFMEGMRTRAGGDAHVFDSFSERGFDSGRGWAVITASNAMEYAFEGTELAADHQVQPSVFTRALADGLASGAADLDADGLVSINEVYDFVYDEVRRENPHQTPSRSVHLQGDLYIACSKRRRTGGEGLPEAVREAVSSPAAFSRLGAVPELRRCLEDSDLELAEAACRALRGLVRNDVKSVAGEAARALEEVSVRPSPGSLDFGRVGQFQPEPHRRIELMGPALAHDCVPRPGDDWIRAQAVEDTVDVSVDTARPGRREGSLTLEGKAGETAVPVRVEVVPASVPTTAPPPPSLPWQAPAPRPTPPDRVPRGPVGGGPGPMAGSVPLPSPRPAQGPAPASGSVPPPAPAGSSPSPPARHSSASLKRRLAARTIDYVLAFLFAFGAVTVVGTVWTLVDDSDSSMNIMANIVATLFFLGWGVLLFLYDWLFLGHGGATLGKMLVSVRVVDARTGGRPSQRQAVRRAALFGLPQTIPVLGNLLVLIESLMAHTDPWTRAPHDRRVGTLVVRVHR
ncbi:caspase, EACC1-associated type [Nocardiopsis aegyptia]|uniref:Putative RDD family membrane protein YckC n=1 Tax=Nocardiopsis aegyptia TaxID=220378 RepID=A0A7Z0JCZ9_9ACTN|nr:RDD family protein [Nocardiopsis aegyptia]NYJ37801.1 putative RDD family membrane protein YckC [Nocardiopsis aegyptia]